MTPIPSPIRSAFTLVEVIISLAILGIVMSIAMQTAVAATQHDIQANARDDIQDDMEAIRKRLGAELSMAGWMFPGSDPAWPTTGATYETCLTNGLLPEDYVHDRDVRYWPKIVGERMHFGADSPAAYMELDPAVRLKRSAWTDLANRIDGLKSALQSNIDATMGTEVETTATVPAIGERAALRKADAQAPVAPCRFLTWVRTVPDAWSANPRAVQDPTLAMGAADWSDASTWGASRPTTRWDANQSVKVLPISEQYEISTGSGRFRDLNDSANELGDLRTGVDIRDGEGVTTTVGTVTVPRAFGMLLQGAMARVDNGGASITLVPQWDTVAAPTWVYADENHDRWRDRGLFLIRSTFGIGRLVIAAKIPCGSIPIGVEPGQRISKTLDDSGNGFVVQIVLSDNVARVACDTWRTISDNDDADNGTSEGLDTCDVRIRLWMAHRNRGDSGGGVIIERSTITVSMRAKTSEDDRLLDRSMLTRLNNPFLLR